MFILDQMVLLRLVVHSKSCLHIKFHISDDYFAIASPETPINLRSTL